MRRLAFFSLLIVLLFLTFKNVNIIFLNNAKSSKFANYNFQGIECIDDVPYVISNFDNVIYGLSKDLKIKYFVETFIRYKNKPIFTHITSFYIREDNFHLVNSMDKINGFEVIVNRKELVSKKKLKDSNYSLRQLKSKNNHVEYSIKNDLVFVDNSKNYKKKSFLRVFENGKEKCQIPHNIKIQNLYYDQKKHQLQIISNLIKYNIGRVYYFEVENICNNKKINFVSSLKTDLIFFPYYELEGVSVCRNEKLYIFIDGKNSYIYKI